MKSLSEFQNKFSEFRSQIKNDSPPIGIEIRNPNYLNEKYFTFLSEQKIAPVLLEGYYMSPITETYSKFKSNLKI
ncbi:MAG: hypothetical protein M5T52_03695 [Ignavibacteriaceae bacterium]|nr:hypothetical protein [Ignavibacteriaceae bacterium]